MKKIILIICICYTNIVFSCNAPLLQDGIVYVGSGPKPNGLQPEVTTIQEAVDLVQDCEFLISTFTVPSGVTLEVTNGSNTIINNNAITLPWVGGSEEITPSDLIRIDNTGNWYEVESVTENTIVTTRPIEMISGSYEYSTSITPSVQLFTRVTGIGQPVYIENIDLKDVHFIEIRPEADSGFAMLTSKSNVKIKSINAPSYGHLRLVRLELTGKSTGGMYLGNPLDVATADNPHDIDLTLESMHVISTRGFDGIKSNYHGNIRITNSEFYSLNDVIFLPYTNSYLPPRSTIIDNSSFVTGGGSIQTHKIITMAGRDNGLYKINDSLISSSTKLSMQEGKAVQFTSSDASSLEISNSRIICTGCNGSNAASVIADGLGTSIVIDNIELSTSPNDCAFLTRNNSSIIISNSSIARNELGEIVTCGDGTGSVTVN